jgi:hypothetical protein
MNEEIKCKYKFLWANINSLSDQGIFSDLIFLKQNLFLDFLSQKLSQKQVSRFTRKDNEKTYPPQFLGLWIFF